MQVWLHFLGRCEEFLHGSNGGEERAAPRAHRPEEPGQHVLHERNFAVPLQRATPRGVFPLRKVRSSPTQVSWFIHTACIFLPGTAVFLPKDACCREDVRGSRPPAPHQAVTVQLATGCFPSPSSETLSRFSLLGNFSVIFLVVLMIIAVATIAVSMVIPALSSICRDPQTKWEAVRARLHLRVFFRFMYYAPIWKWSHQLFILCLKLTFIFSKGEWPVCDCLWLFDVRHVARRVWLCFPGGFSFSPREAVPSLQEEDSAGRAGVSDLCAEWAPRGSQGKSPAVAFGDRSCFLFALHDVAFHGITAYPPLMNYVMWLLKTVVFFLCFIPTYTR